MIEFAQSEVERLVLPEPNSGCWLFLGGLTLKGYAQISVDGRLRQAHRVSYEVFVGPIQDGLEIDHLCRVRSCLNPHHLEPVTHAENVKRSSAAAASRERARSIVKCKYGHDYTPANTIIQKPHGGRACRICRTEREQLRHPNRTTIPVVACPRGHPYDSENTYTHNGKRYCRRCNTESAKRRRPA